MFSECWQSTLFQIKKIKNSHGEGFWFTCTWKERFQRKLSDKKSSFWSGMVWSGMVVHQGFHVVGSGVHVSSTGSAHRQIYEANQSFCLTAFWACSGIWGAWKVPLPWWFCCRWWDGSPMSGCTTRPHRSTRYTVIWCVSLWLLVYQYKTDSVLQVSTQMGPGSHLFHLAFLCRSWGV